MIALLPIVAGLVIVLGTAPNAVVAQDDAAGRGVGTEAGPRLLPPRAWPRRDAALPAPLVGPGPVVPRPSPTSVSLLSGVLPGAGQHLLGQRRKWAYLGLETIGWIAYLDRRSSGSELRVRYRDFAWSEARLQLTPRVDGDFGYYETLSKWLQSGDFDTDGATPGVQPEPDAMTYNGTIWNRAIQLFLPGGSGVAETDPRYQRALEYYREHAYGQEYLWDWSGTGMAQDEFGSLIRRSDDRFRQATNVLGLVLANHLVSMLDAFVSARAPATSVSSGLVPMGASGGVLWSTRVEVAISW